MTGNYKQQSGIALIISLIILLLLTIIMISALQVTTIEEKMAGNSQNQNIAFQAAESALREAEGLIHLKDILIDWDRDGADDDVNPFNKLMLTGIDVPFRETEVLSCVDGLCTRSGVVPGVFPSVSEANMRTASTGIANIAAQPKYIIEMFDPSIIPDSDKLKANFRISVRAWGSDLSSVVELQSTYSDLWEPWMYSR